MIYYVEDDASIRNLIVYTLGRTGFSIEGFPSSVSFWQAMERQRPELILLDIMLPGESGAQILARLRADERFARIPVIMLTAKDGEDDVVASLDCGADDYLPKPFGMMELIARVKAVLRRSADGEAHAALRVGEIHMDVDRHIVRAGGSVVSLALKEYELLRLLMENAGRLVERSRIIESVWAKDYVGADHTLDSHIQTLRSKLGAYGSQIQTVYRCGYRLLDPDAPPEPPKKRSLYSPQQ